MPFAWESEESRRRLEKLHITPPPSSGLAVILTDDDRLYRYHPGHTHSLLGTMSDGRRKQLRDGFEEACDEERNRKLRLINDVMVEVDQNIRKMASGEVLGTDLHGATVRDLQGLWYVLREVMGRSSINPTVPCGTIGAFVKDYWADLCPALVKVLGREKSVLEGLLVYPCAGLVNPQYFYPQADTDAKKDTCEEHLDQFFSQVSKQMAEFPFIFKVTGCMAHHCKVGYNDEYHYTLEFQNIEMASRITSSDLYQVTCLFVHNEIRVFDLHLKFMEVTRSLVNEASPDRLTLLANDDTELSAPLLLFKWTPDDHKPEDWVLVTTHCHLTIPCPNVWPGVRNTKPDGSPITQVAHLVLPNKTAPMWHHAKSWRWSMHATEEEFFSTLPKHVKLGLAISTIICSPVLFPEAFCPPRVGTLQYSLFNAVANKAIELPVCGPSSDDITVQGIQVADVIIAGLERAQYQYYYKDDRDVNERKYIPSFATSEARVKSVIRCNGFLAQHLLYLLAQDYLDFHGSGHKLESLIPSTLCLVKGSNDHTSLDLTRGMLGLLGVGVDDGDSWRKVTEDAALR